MWVKKEQHISCGSLGTHQPCSDQSFTSSCPHYLDIGEMLLDIGIQWLLTMLCGSKHPDTSLKFEMEARQPFVSQNKISHLSIVTSLFVCIHTTVSLVTYFFVCIHTSFCPVKYTYFSACIHLSVRLSLSAFTHHSVQSHIYLPAFLHLSLRLWLTGCKTPSYSLFKAISVYIHT